MSKKLPAALKALKAFENAYRALPKAKQQELLDGFSQEFAVSRGLLSDPLVLVTGNAIADLIGGGPIADGFILDWTSVLNGEHSVGGFVEKHVQALQPGGADVSASASRLTASAGARNRNSISTAEDANRVTAAVVTVLAAHGTMGELPVAAVAGGGTAGTAAVGTALGGLAGAAYLGYKAGQMIDRAITDSLGKSLGAWIYDVTHADEETDTADAGTTEGASDAGSAPGGTSSSDSTDSGSGSADGGTGSDDTDTGDTSTDDTNSDDSGSDDSGSDDSGSDTDDSGTSGGSSGSSADDSGSTGGSSECDADSGTDTDEGHPTPEGGTASVPPLIVAEIRAMLAGLKPLRPGGFGDRNVTNPNPDAAGTTPRGGVNLGDSRGGGTPRPATPVRDGGRGSSGGPGITDRGLGRDRTPGTPDPVDPMGPEL